MAKQKVKINKKLLMVIAVLVVISGGVIIWLQFFSGGISDDELNDLFATKKTISTSIPSDILEDDRINQLHQFGPTTVDVKERGRKTNPFEPF